MGKAAFSWFDQAAARIIRHSGRSSSKDAASSISSAQNADPKPPSDRSDEATAMAKSGPIRSGPRDLANRLREHAEEREAGNPEEQGDLHCLPDPVNPPALLELRVSVAGRATDRCPIDPSGRRAYSDHVAVLQMRYSVVWPPQPTQIIRVSSSTERSKHQWIGERTGGATCHAIWSASP